MLNMENATTRNENDATTYLPKRNHPNHRLHFIKKRRRLSFNSFSHSRIMVAFLSSLVAVKENGNEPYSSVSTSIIYQSFSPLQLLLQLPIYIFFNFFFCRWLQFFHLLTQLLYSFSKAPSRVLNYLHYLHRLLMRPEAWELGQDESNFTLRTHFWIANHLPNFPRMVLVDLCIWLLSCMEVDIKHYENDTN